MFEAFYFIRQSSIDCLSTIFHLMECFLGDELVVTKKVNDTSSLPKHISYKYKYPENGSGASVTYIEMELSTVHFTNIFLIFHKVKFILDFLFGY